jgi:hypothetical protein
MVRPLSMAFIGAVALGAVGGAQALKLGAPKADSLGLRPVQMYALNTTGMPTTAPYNGTTTNTTTNGTTTYAPTTTFYPTTAPMTTSPPMEETGSGGVTYEVPTSIAVGGMDVKVAFPYTEAGATITAPIVYTIGGTNFSIPLEVTNPATLPTTAVMLTVDLSISSSSVNQSAYIYSLASMLGIPETRIQDITVAAATSTQSTGALRRSSLQSFYRRLATTAASTVSTVISADPTDPTAQPPSVIAASVEALVQAQAAGLIALPGTFASADSAQVSLVPTTSGSSKSAEDIGLGVGLGLGGGLVLCAVAFVGIRSHLKKKRNFTEKNGQDKLPGGVVIESVAA